MTRETMTYTMAALLAAGLLSGPALADGVAPALPSHAGSGTIAALGPSAEDGTGGAAPATAAANPAADRAPGPLAGLTPGNRKIARALHEAQDGGGKGALRLDDIAAARREGFAWSDIFRQMKARGLVQEKNIGQVISRHARGAPDGEPAATDGAADVAAAHAGDGGDFIESLRRPDKRPARAASRSKLKPTARPTGDKGSGALMTLVLGG